MIDKHLVTLLFALTALAICASAQGQVMNNSVSRGIVAPSISVGSGASNDLRQYGSEISDRLYTRTSVNPLAAGDRPTSSGISKNSGKARINARRDSRRNSSRISAFAGSANSSVYNSPANNRQIAADQQLGKFPPMLAATNNEFSVNANDLGQIPKSHYFSPLTLARRKGLTTLGTLSSKKSLSSYQVRRSLSAGNSLLTESRIRQNKTNRDVIPNVSW